MLSVPTTNVDSSVSSISNTYPIQDYVKRPFANSETIINRISATNTLNDNIVRTVVAANVYRTTNKSDSWCRGTATVKRDICSIHTQSTGKRDQTTHQELNRPISTRQRSPERAWTGIVQIANKDDWLPRTT